MIIAEEQNLLITEAEVSRKMIVAEGIQIKEFFSLRMTEDTRMCNKLSSLRAYCEER